MKTIIRKLLTLTLALLLCLSPLAAQAQSLLNDGLTKAFDAGRSVEATIGIELDDTLGMIGLLPSESFAAVQELLAATTIKIFAIPNGEAMPELGIELRIKDALIMDGRAWLVGDQLAITTNLLPGKTLMMDGAEFVQGFEQSAQQITAQAESLEAIGGSAEKYLAVIASWAESTEGLLSFSELETPKTDRRDAAVRTVTLRVTPDQLKELLSALVQELSRDEALAQFLSETPSPEEIQALVSTGNVMEWTILFDEHDGIAGVDGSVPAMFGDASVESTFAYDHSVDGGVERHAFGGEIAEEGADAIGFSLETRSDSANPQAPNGSFSLKFQQASGASTTVLQADHTYARTLAADRETLESKTDIGMQSTSGDTTAETMQSMGATALSVSLDFTSDTQALAGNDFVSKNALGISFMGMPFGRVLVTLASGAYVPADSAGNEVVDLAGLDEAGAAALYTELNAGLEQAIGNAMATLPPELLTLFLAVQGN